MNTRAINTRKLLLVLCASILIDYIGYGIVIPFLPFYAQSFGASPTTIGMLISIFPLMQIFTSFLWGKLSDRIGCRLALLLNILGSSLSYLMLGLANSLWVLFAARALAGSASSSIVIAQSYIADMTRPEDRAGQLGLLEASIGIGFILGPAIGGFLAGADLNALNFQLPGVAAAIASFITLAFAYITLPQQTPKVCSKSLREPTVSQANTHALKATVKRGIQTVCHPQLGTLLGIVFLGMICYITIQTTLALWCEHQFGWGPQQFSCLIVFCGVLGVIIQIGLLKPLLKRFSETQLLFWGFILGATGFFLIPFSDSIVLLVGALTIGSCGQAICLPLGSSLISQLSAPNEQGANLGLSKSVGGFASVVGAVWAGFMFESIGPAWPYWSGAMILLGAAALSHKYLSSLYVPAMSHQKDM